MLNIIFIGSSTPLALTALQSLIATNQTILALFTSDTPQPNAPKLFPVHIENNETLNQLARLHHIPCIHLNKPLKDYLPRIKSLNADLILTCCFSQKLPPSIFTLPPLGAVNIHPSLLPTFRGPDPVFWQYKLACETWGLSLHKIARQFDTGNIIDQQHCDIPDGLRSSQCIHSLAKAIPELLSLGLVQLKSTPMLSSIQNEHHASTQSLPTPSDYTLVTKMSARHTFNFICAYATINTPIKYAVQERIFWLIKGISYNHIIISEARMNKNIITFPCTDGQISARYYFE